MRGSELRPPVSFFLTFRHGMLHKNDSKVVRKKYSGDLVVPVTFKVRMRWQGVGKGALFFHGSATRVRRHRLSRHQRIELKHLKQGIQGVLFR